METVLGPQLTRDRWVPVLRDARRRLLNPREYLELHFQTRGRPLGHGYTRENAARGQGYYAFSPKPGLRFVVLDTVADSGDQGNVDSAQFGWLDAELTAAEARREVVVVFGHHPIASMVNAAPGVHLGRGDCSSRRNRSSACCTDMPAWSRWSSGTSTATGSRRIRGPEAGSGRS